jgi:molybdopterin synthase catalytic subunit
MAHLRLFPFDPQAELSAFTRRRTDAGALASFVGIVRGQNEQVKHLKLECYPAFTQIVLDKIEAEGQARFDVLATLVIHRAGMLGVGEPIVLVGALSHHRKAALACVDYLMDHLKTQAPFWKQEIGENQTTWIEPRSQDYQARQNWDQET